jgi:hypothetical protein
MDIEDPKSPAVSAHDRELASSKSITITPLHTEVVPDTPDSFELTAGRAKESFIANAPNDIEETAAPEPPATPILPTKRRKASKTHVVSGIVVGAGVVVAAIIFIH